MLTILDRMINFFKDDDEAFHQRFGFIVQSSNFIRKFNQFYSENISHVHLLPSIPTTTISPLRYYNPIPPDPSNYHVTSLSKAFHASQCSPNRPQGSGLAGFSLPSLSFIHIGSLLGLEYAQYVLACGLHSSTPST